MDIITAIVAHIVIRAVLYVPSSHYQRADRFARYFLYVRFA